MCVFCLFVMRRPGRPSRWFVKHFHYRSTEQATERLNQLWRWFGAANKAQDVAFENEPAISLRRCPLLDISAHLFNSSMTIFLFAQIVSGYTKGLIKYWNIDTGKCLHTIETGNASITSMCYNPFEKKFAASSNNKVFLPVNPLENTCKTYN